MPLACHLFTSIHFSALDKRTHVTPAFSCSPLLPAPPAANSPPLCNNTAGDAQRRTRQSISPLRPAPMMFLKNILIDAAIKRDKSKRRSSGASVWRVCYFPGQVYLDIADVWLAFEPEFTVEKIFAVTDCSDSPRRRVRLSDAHHCYGVRKCSRRV